MTRSEFLARWPEATDSTLRANGFDPLATKAQPAAAPDIRTVASTDEQKLNKLESAYLAYLRVLGLDWIGVQCLTLKLANDCRYSPDFITIEHGRLQARETKGWFRDDAKVKLAVAARVFTWIEFILVRRNENGGWDHQIVKP